MPSMTDNAMPNDSPTKHEHGFLRGWAGCLFGFDLEAARLQAQIAVLRERVLAREALVREREALIRERETTVRERESIIEGLRARSDVVPSAGLSRDSPVTKFGARKLDVPPTEIIRHILPHLEGWCSVRKALWLAELITTHHCRVILEIGVYGGRSLIPMALAARSNGPAVVYGIEPWSNEVAVAQPTSPENDDWWRKVDLKEIKSRFLATVLEWDLIETVKLVELPSGEARAAFQSGSMSGFDLIHIDGSHAEGQALADVTQWLPLLKPGGIFVLDDILWETVSKARDYLRRNLTVVEEVEEGNDVAYGAYLRPDRQQETATKVIESAHT